MTPRATCDIPESVLDEAFRWAVVLNSGTTGQREQSEFERWLQAPLHRSAWQCIQVVEQEFAAARGGARRGLQVLDRVAGERRKRRLRHAVGTLLSLALLAGLLLSPLRYLWQSQYVTGDERETIALAGGARIDLDSGTALDVEQVDGRTVLHLYRGRILVDSSAAAPADKPRIVTEHGSFTPLGTRFVVTGQDDATELAMLQGRVQITPNDGVEAEATAGQQWQVTTRRAQSIAGNGLVPDGWADGVIEADNARLDDVLAAIGRYRRGWLHCDPAVASLRVTGLFHLDDTDGALQALQQSLPVQVEYTTHWWVSVQAR